MILHYLLNEFHSVLLHLNNIYKTIILWHNRLIMQSFLDISGVQSNEKTLLLDISAIPTKEDCLDDDIIN